MHEPSEELNLLPGAPGTHLSKHVSVSLETSSVNMALCFSSSRKFSSSALPLGMPLMLDRGKGEERSSLYNKSKGVTNGALSKSAKQEGEERARDFPDCRLQKGVYEARKSLE
eukprot:TRINITY_DN25306_c0_g1_i1.p1 TRINITY_DN25306_c0_g1~~TRINITY_DN25306_c0_g1_i1.p1  ORF type:complete len:113 (-),score=13.17 TRINITY_DN25306_c0_g1_i1:130-468(-)